MKSQESSLKSLENINIESQTRRDNRTVIKALIVGDENKPSVGPQDRGTSKVKPPEDYWADYQGLYIEPPVDMEFLSTIEEYSTILNQCIEAMEVNIEGFGYLLKPLVSIDDLEEKDPALMKAMSEEKRMLDNFLKGSTGEDSLTTFRRKCRHDREATGNSYFEIVRHPYTRKPDKLVHIPSYQVKLGKLDDEYTEYMQYRQVETSPGKFEVVQVKDVKRFRKFLQLQYGSVNSKIVYFKEYGDPRTIDCRTGDVVTKPLEEKYQASEVIHQRIYSSRTPYGLPRYKGCLITLLGDRESEEVNYTTLKNNNIPSMIVAVSNGMITQETVDRLQQFTKEQIQGSKNYSKFLVLEAEGIFEGTDPGNIRLDVKPLSPYQTQDQLFQEYGKENREKVRRAFRLPPIFLGDSSDYTRSTSDTSRRLADEQIFAPERDEVDFIFNKILLEFGMRHHTFKSNSPNITDDSDLLKLLVAAEKTGGMTPRIASEIVADILGKSIVKKWPEGINPDVPFSAQMAEMVKNKAATNEPGQQLTALKREDKGQDALLALMDLREKLVSEIQGRSK